MEVGLECLSPGLLPDGRPPARLHWRVGVAARGQGMTEPEWLASADIGSMLEFLRGKARVALVGRPRASTW